MRLIWAWSVHGQESGDLHPQLWNEWAEKNKAGISNEERKFVEETCRPEKINIEGPCVHFIRETLEVLKFTKSEGSRVTGPYMLSVVPANVVKLIGRPPR